MLLPSAPPKNMSPLSHLMDHSIPMAAILMEDLESQLKLSNKLAINNPLESPYLEKLFESKVDFHICVLSLITVLFALGD